MAMDFPSSPSVGAIYQAPGGPAYKFDGTLWVPMVGAAAPLFQRRNRLTNPSMQISQENGDAAMGPINGATYYPADQWVAAWSFTGTAGMMRSQRTGPAASGNNCMELVCTAGATLAAGNYIQIFQPVEGEKIKDFRWGTSSAKRVVLRFAFYTTLAGVYTANVRNHVIDRTFLAKFTALANTWQVITIPVPGDTTGTWLTTAALAMYVGIGLGAGSTYIGVEGWQAGQKIVTADTINGAVTNAAFYATDLGLYLDEDGTGLAPRFETPDIGDALRDSQRYFQRHMGVLVPSGWGAAGAPFYWGSFLPVTMMKAPTFAIVGTPIYSNASGIVLNAAQPDLIRLSAITTAAGASWCDCNFNLNARP